MTLSCSIANLKYEVINGPHAQQEFKEVMNGPHAQQEFKEVINGPYAQQEFKKVASDDGAEGQSVDHYYRSVIHHCAKNGLLEKAEGYLCEMMSRGFTPTSINFNTVINASATCGDCDRAEYWLGVMIQRGVQPTEVTYGSICKAFARQGDVGKVDCIMQRYKAIGGKLNEYFYAALLSACERASPIDTDRAQRAIFEMVEQGLQVSRVVKPLTSILGPKLVHQLRHRANRVSGFQGVVDAASPQRRGVRQNTELVWQQSVAAKPPTNTVWQQSVPTEPPTQTKWQRSAVSKPTQAVWHQEGATKPWNQNLRSEKISVDARPYRVQQSFGEGNLFLPCDESEDDEYSSRMPSICTTEAPSENEAIYPATVTYNNGWRNAAQTSYCNY